MKLYIAAVLLLLNGASAFTFNSPSVKLSSTPMTMSMEKFDKSKTFFPFESSMPSSTQLMAKKDDLEEKDDRGDLKQLLGIRGASETDDVLRIRIQLTKPVTWIPLIWGVICGAAASGNYEWSNPLTVGMEGHVPLDKGLSDFAKVVTCMILAGPFLTGFTQTINDWYDREIDAINEPNRPIPSGKISEYCLIAARAMWKFNTGSKITIQEEVIGQIWFLLLGGLGLAYGIDVWVGHDVPTVFLLSVFGSFISYIYSAPPLKLKQSWVGNYALGASYIALPWWCGQAAFGELTWDVVVLTVLYSLAGLGIAIVNDFKSIEGDRALGLQSLPVAFGVEKAKWICVSTIDVTQLAVAAYLYWSGQPTYGLVLLGLVLPQIALQAKYLIPDPINNDVKYQASAQPFLVFGILTTALAIGHR